LAPTEDSAEPCRARLDNPSCYCDRQAAGPQKVIEKKERGGEAKEFAIRRRGDKYTGSEKLQFLGEGG
jgi:hypothetical protein